MFHHLGEYSVDFQLPLLINIQAKILGKWKELLNTLPLINISTSCACRDGHSDTQIYVCMYCM